MSKLSLKKTMKYFKECNFKIYNPFKSADVEYTPVLNKYDVIHTTDQVYTVQYNGLDVIYVGLD